MYTKCVSSNAHNRNKIQVPVPTKEQGSHDFGIRLWGTKILSKRPTRIETDRARTHFSGPHESYASYFYISLSRASLRLSVPSDWSN
jgi:hypothetical protein